VSAASCLVRGESRGAHQRVDLPATDPALHGCHVVLDGSEQARIEHWE
jgi:succinate dehydrogenase/fumarate reductase flavoprotein subunit